MEGRSCWLPGLLASPRAAPAESSKAHAEARFTLDASRWARHVGRVELDASRVAFLWHTPGPATHDMWRQA